jgi:hypothetical protein
VAEIDWASLACEHRLGEGASGVIYRAQWRAEGRAPRAVAVKLFKGAVTSDGLPDCEMAACLHAGRHPNMIPVIGKLRGHPDGAHGLVMELVDPALTNLAGPPSFASCTRDVYAADARAGRRSAARTRHRIGRRASACARHHARRPVRAQHPARRGRRRAARRFRRGVALRRERPRARGAVRAAGSPRVRLLLRELLERCEPRAWAAAQALGALAAACVNDEVDARPSFEQIVAALAATMD